MAVRNIEAIERKTEQMAQEKQQVENTRRSALKVYVDSITAKKQDLIDAVDTYTELAKRSIPRDFESGTNIRFASLQYKGGYEIKIIKGNERDSVSFSYDPKEELFLMKSGGSVRKFCKVDDLDDCDIRNFLHESGTWAVRSENMRNAIREFTEQIDVFLHAFFNFVDNL